MFQFYRGNNLVSQGDWKIFLKGDSTSPFGGELTEVSQVQELQWKTGAVVNQTQLLEWLSGGFVDRERQITWITGLTASNIKEFSWAAGGQTQKELYLHLGVNGILNMAYGLEAYKFNRYRIPNNVNYDLFRILDITNTSGSSFTTGTTLELEFDHAAMVAAGESDEYGDQLRLTHCPTDMAEKELDIEIINPNTSTTKLRFKLQRGLANGATVSDYRLYSKVRDTALFEETFRDKKNVYYFHATALSSQVALENGDFTSESTGIQRLDDTNIAKIGFNVPGDADVEVEFRFLDDGANDSSRYIGIEWRGDGNVARTFAVDNDNATTNNQIANFYNGTSFAPITPVDNIKTIPARIRVKVFGDTVELYLNDILLDTITDATAATGGMKVCFPAGSEALISKLSVSRAIGTYTVALGSPVTNVTLVDSSHKVLLDNGFTQNIQCTVIRLKKQPDNRYILEDMKTIGEWGDVIPATKGQAGSVEIHLFNNQNATFASVMELNT